MKKAAKKEKPMQTCVRWALVHEGSGCLEFVAHPSYTKRLALALRGGGQRLARVRITEVTR